MARAKKIPLITDFNHIPAEALVPEEEQPYPLPAHWKWVRLGTTVKNITAKTESFDAADKYLGLEDLNAGGGILRISDTHDLKSAKTVFQYGDVLYGKLRPYLNKHAVVNFSGVCSTDILALRPEKAIDATYLDFWISTPFFLNAAITNSKGVNLPRVSFNSIAQYPFPLPPLAEQKQIVAYLDEKLGKIDSVRKKLQDFLDQAAQRKDNLIQAGIAGHLTESWRYQHDFSMHDWEVTTLGEKFQWSSGGTPSRQIPEFYDGNIPWVKSGELPNGMIYTTKEHISEKAVASSSAKIFPVGTVLIAMYGATIGKVGILGIEAATNQAVAAALPSNHSSKEYLFYFLVGNKDRFIELGKGGAQPNISQTVIKAFPYQIPPLLEQEEIARILDEQLERTERTDKLVAEVLERLDTIKQQIVSAALAGRLSLQIS